MNFCIKEIIRPIAREISEHIAMSYPNINGYEKFSQTDSIIERRLMNMQDKTTWDIYNKITCTLYEELDIVCFKAFIETLQEPKNDISIIVEKILKSDLKDANKNISKVYPYITYEEVKTWRELADNYKMEFATLSAKFALMVLDDHKKTNSILEGVS